jgi:hypothetical protein
MGRVGSDGKHGSHGKKGKDGRHGKDGPDGAKGPPGKQGEQGDPGDEVKSELQVHLNALKGYVDMKFDVLKGMLGGAEGGAAAPGEEDLDLLRKSMDDSMTRMESM